LHKINKILTIADLTIFLHIVKYFLNGKNKLIIKTYQKNE